MDYPPLRSDTRVSLPLICVWHSHTMDNIFNTTCGLLVHIHLIYLQQFHLWFVTCGGSAVVLNNWYVPGTHASTYAHTYMLTLWNTVWRHCKIDLGRSGFGPDERTAGAQEWASSANQWHSTAWQSNPTQTETLYCRYMASQMKSYRPQTGTHASIFLFCGQICDFIIWTEFFFFFFWLRFSGLIKFCESLNRKSLHGHKPATL